jgi:polar amino acid transport system substrate-binding protein
MKRLSLLIAGMMTVFWLNAAAAQTLNVGSAEWRPWQIVENGHLIGITPDLLQEIARRAGLEMKLRWLPHKRVMIAFENGTIDMEPTVNPVWRETCRVKSVYTQPFYFTGDIVLVRKENGIKGTDVTAFHGMTLGCGLGYYYPEGFQKAFDAGDILREDNPVPETNLKKLALKRLDGIIVDKIQARYIIRKVGLNPDRFSTAYAFKPSQLCMRLHPSREDLLPILNAVLVQMQTDGTIDRIVDSYLN